MESEEFEKVHLVDAEDKEISPPMSPVIGQILATPPSPTSNKVSSGGGSLSSRTINKYSIAPTLTPVPGATNSRFLYVNQKLGNLSRRPSVLSDNSSKTPKESSLNVKMTNMKRDGNSKLEAASVLAPPNTPTPMKYRTASDVDLDSHSETWQRGSASSSRLTTKALASDSDTIPEEKGSTETLKTMEHNGNQVDALSFFKLSRISQTGARSVGSNAYMKSLRAHQRAHHRDIHHHSFFTDTTDVRQMEHALLQLLEDFHSGKLRAFAKDGSMEQMQGIREQQERLARLHFDLGARQELYPPLSDEGLRANQDNMHHLMSSLQQLSQSIENLQLFSKGANS